MPKGHFIARPERNWTEPDIALMEEALERGWSNERIGRALGRSANAVNVMRKRLGIPSVLRQSTLWSGRRVARALGVDEKVPACWARKRWIAGTRGVPRGGGRQWYVTEDALLAFLENPAHWHRWDPGRITERWLREWALELPRPCYLTVGEVARRYHVTIRAVASWLDSGELPFVRHGNRMVDERVLAGWVPPYDRSRTSSSSNPVSRRNQR